MENLKNIENIENIKEKYKTLNKDDYVIDKSGEMNEGVYFVLCENDYFKELIFAKVEIIRIKKNEKLKLEILQNKKVM